MFGIVVVPGDSIVVQKREKLIAIPLEAIFTFQRRLALPIRFLKFAIKAFHTGQMFLQKVFFETVSVNGLNHWSQQNSKSRYNFFELVIEGIIQNLVVQVPHQMDEAALLR